MKLVKPFNGIRFNPDKTDIGKCIAPPYDVFNYGDTLDSALRSHLNNIVHIQKPLGNGDDKYNDADEIFKRFFSEEILVQDKEEGIYILEQTWNGSSRTGIIAAVKLDETYKRIRPHEKTKSGPIIDRLKLTQSTGLNIGSIFLVFKDDDNTATNLINNELKRARPLYDFSYPDKINNRLFFSNNIDLLSSIENKTFYIADGHHRYKTMTDFRDIMRKNSSSVNSENNYEYAMMFIVPHTEVTILPYNRLIKDIDIKLINSLPDKINSAFNVTETTDNINIPPHGKIGMYINKTYFLLTPKNRSSILDIEILHKDILEPHLKLDEETIKKTDSVHYISGEMKTDDILKLVDSDKYQAGFLLAPVSFDEIINISNSGKTMPRKSTYFYPKVPSGIVLYKAT